MAKKGVARVIVQKPSDKEMMSRYTADRFSAGVKHQDIIADIMNRFKINHISALSVVNDCKDILKNQLQIRVPFILSSHIERYELLYTRFQIIGRTDLMNKCLSQKEELLNLKEALSERLREDFVSEAIENKFMANKLSPEKLGRLKELISKGIVT